MQDQQLQELMDDRQVILPSEPLTFRSTETLFLCSPPSVCHPANVAGDDGCHPLPSSHTGSIDHSAVLISRRAVQAGERCPSHTLLTSLVPLAEWTPIRQWHMPTFRAKAEQEWENSRRERR
ncbi:unnamed protein product [Coregonus sp. 'balchen']|nr:unnamed protein product [Coregonus sp. 'balchen']